MSLFKIETLALGCVLGLLACTATPEAVDGPNDSFSQGAKTDTAGIAEGSPDAIAVLHVANYASEEVLRDDAPDGVDLARRTVDNLIYVRLGDDGIPGTSDDGSFATLAALDAVPYVGPVAFRKLLAYARTHNISPPDADAGAGISPDGGTNTSDGGTVGAPGTLSFSWGIFQGSDPVPCDAVGGKTFQLLTMRTDGQVTSQFFDCAEFKGESGPLPGGTYRLTGHLIDANNHIIAQSQSFPHDVVINGGITTAGFSFKF